MFFFTKIVVKGGVELDFIVLTDENLKHLSI